MPTTPFRKRETRTRMPHRHTLHCLWLTLALLSLMACSHRPSTYTFRHIDQEEWETGDTIRFALDTIRHSGRYTIDLELRTTAHRAYPYRSLWLAIRTVRTSPPSLSCDTLECPLIAEDGRSLGSGISMRSHTFRLKTLSLLAGEAPELRISHIMRTRILSGVSDIGIKVTRVGDE